MIAETEQHQEEDQQLRGLLQSLATAAAPGDGEREPGGAPGGPGGDVVDASSPRISEQEGYDQS